jgi:hypothetical protein
MVIKYSPSGAGEGDYQKRSISLILAPILGVSALFSGYCIYGRKYVFADIE